MYLSNAELQGKFCLRACIVNHLTKESDIDQVVPEVVEAVAGDCNGRGNIVLFFTSHFVIKWCS